MPQPRSLANVIKSYRFLLAKEHADEAFTVDEAVEAIGWKKSTVTTYINKKWASFLTQDGKSFYVKGVSAYQEEQYVRMISQNQRVSSEPHKPLFELEVERLVVKAREAAMHALDSL